MDLLLFATVLPLIWATSIDDNETIEEFEFFRRSPETFFVRSQAFKYIFEFFEAVHFHFNLITFFLSLNQIFALELQ